VTLKILLLFVFCLAERLADNTVVELDEMEVEQESSMDALATMMEGRFDKNISSMAERKRDDTRVVVTQQVSQDKGSYKLVARKPARIRPSQGTSSSIYDKGELYPHPSKLYIYYPQSRVLHFRIEPCWMNIIFLVYRNGSLHNETIDALRLANTKMKTMIDIVPELMDVDFTPLMNERVGYAEQQEIDPHRVRMVTACGIYYGLDMGLVARLHGDEVTGRWKDVDKIMSVAREFGTESDADHIERQLTHGCPSGLDYEETQENKTIFLERGNEPSVDLSPDLVAEALNEEERNSHVIPFMGWVVWFAACAHTVMQAILNRKGSKCLRFAC
jgi:hypothetical protein